MLEEFKKIVMPTQNKLYRFALRLLGSTQEAEDVVQEVMLKVWDKRSELPSYQNVEAWCMKITKNLSLDKLKSKHRKMQFTAVEVDIPTGEGNPQKTAEINDTMQQLKKIMAQLPSQQQMVMQLRDVEGYSYKEISSMLDLSMDQVKVNLFRARDKVRKQLIKTERYGI